MAIPTDATMLQAPANWRESYIVTYAFLTDVLTATDGTEQRLARRRSPRKTIGFTASLPYSQARVFEGQVNRGQGRRFILPELPMSVPMDRGMAAGAQTLQIASVPAWAAKKTIVVLRDRDYMEARSIVNVGSSSITFNETSAYAWPASAIVAPGRVGQVSDKMQGLRLSSTVLEVPILLTESPASAVYPVYYDAVFTRGPLFNNKELFPIRPNWATNPQITYDTERTTLDYDQGVTENYDFSNLRSRLTQYAFVGIDYATVKVATDFFFRMKGQQRAFYLPTFASDMLLAVAFNPGDTVLYMQGRDLYDNIGVDGVYRNIALMTPSGVVPLSINTIGVTNDGLNTTLVLNKPVPAGVVSSTVSQICWLNLVRFATDTLSVSWLTSAVAQFNMTFKTLPDAIGEIRINGLSITIGGSYPTVSEYQVLEEEKDRALFGDYVLLIGDRTLTIGGP